MAKVRKEKLCTMHECFFLFLSKIQNHPHSWRNFKDDLYHKIHNLNSHALILFM